MKYHHKLFLCYSRIHQPMVLLLVKGMKFEWTKPSYVTIENFEAKNYDMVFFSLS